MPISRAPLWTWIAIAVAGACSKAKSPQAKADALLRELPAASALVLAAPQRALMLRASPDGKSIAYLAPTLSDPALNPSLEGYALFVDSSRGNEQLSAGAFRPWFATPPAWRPDGAVLALTFEIKDEDGRLGTALGFAAAGGGMLEARFTFPRGAMWRGTPAWSPDGKQLAIAGTSANGTNLCVFDRSGSLISQRDTPGEESGWAQCSWSHDGARIAVVARQKLYLFDSPDKAARVVSTVPYPDSEASTQPLWIDNDKSLVLGAGSGVWRVELASGSIIRLFGARTIVDVVSTEDPAIVLGLEEREVKPQGLDSAAKAVETLAGAGHARDHYERTPVLLDLRDLRERQITTLRRTDNEQTLTRDAALPAAVRQAFSKRP